MNRPVPNQVSIDPKSPHYDPDYRRIGVRINGVEKTNVAEFHVEEAWARIQVGRVRDRQGKLMTTKISGKIETYWRQQGQQP